MDDSLRSEQPFPRIIVVDLPAASLEVCSRGC